MGTSVQGATILGSRYPCFFLLLSILGQKQEPENHISGGQDLSAFPIQSPQSKSQA